MKKEMAESLVAVDASGGSSLLDFDVDLSWLELPEVDCSFFDFLDW